MITVETLGKVEVKKKVLEASNIIQYIARSIVLTLQISHSKLHSLSEHLKLNTFILKTGNLL